MIAAAPASLGPITIVLPRPLRVTRSVLVWVGPLPLPWWRTVTFPAGKVIARLTRVSGGSLPGIGTVDAGGDVLTWRFEGPLPPTASPGERWMFSGHEHSSGVPIGARAGDGRLRAAFVAAMTPRSQADVTGLLVQLIELK